MKVYISADIEGISGVVDRTHTMAEGRNYAQARKLMTEEVNAAIRGAVAAGASEILVNDSHGYMNNILIEDLDENAQLITGCLKLFGMMEGLDASFDAAMLIGYHGRHGTNAVLAHSYSSSTIREIQINGQIVGEFELNTYLSAYYAVPLVFVSGDDVLAQQVQEFCPDIRALIVKKAISRNTARCLHPRHVHALLNTAVCEALQAQEKDPVKLPKLGASVELQVSFMNNAMAEQCLLLPGVSLVSGSVVRYKATDIAEAYKMRQALSILAASTL